MTRSNLTPPAELVGRTVTWRPRRADGARITGRPVLGRVKAYDQAARCLVITVQRDVSPWQPVAESDVRVSLSQGPFRPL